MESENKSFFTQDDLYGEYADEMILNLSLKPSCLVGDTALKFQNLILRHCERAWTSRECTLPSFGNDGDWINTRRPLDFEKDLNHRVYLMDFFTYCCINCTHILPYLKKVEHEHAKNSGFTVIGIHSPKFPNEKHFERVKEAVHRNDIKHPVLNDPETKLWKLYGIMCWPTVFIVGPAHTLLFILVGESQIDKVSFLCQHVLKYFESCSVKLASSRLPILPLEEPVTEKTHLLFPGSISTDGCNCLVVSDTRHNQLVVMSKDLKVQETIGSGMKGSNDGPFNSASFNAPNGTSFFNGMLYVADTGNHSIRKVDFKRKLVSTVFRSEDHVNNSQDEPDSKPECKTFQSPWDVCVGPKLGSDLTELNTLYIAVAGSHQIWSLDLHSNLSEAGFCVPFAGSGKEENKPNLYRLRAGFAQPSGIAYSSCSPGFLYVADSESSTIKAIDLRANGAVKTVVGGSLDPSDLFQFGDKDGQHINAKLQHPMSVCVVGLHLLVVTDTYNHKMKLIDAENKTCTTLNTNLELCEPSGVCYVSNSDQINVLCEKTLFIADTNNHRIVPIPLYASSLEEVICPADIVIESYSVRDVDADPETILPLAYDGKVLCYFKWNLSPGFKLSQKICSCDIKHEGDGAFKFEFLSPEEVFGSYQPSLKMTSKAECLKQKGKEEPKSKITVSCRVASCNKNVCEFSRVNFKVGIDLQKSGPKCVHLFFNA